MINDLKQRYKVEKSNVEEAYEYQLGLKANPEFEEMVYNTFLEIANLFKETYPDVRIEPPRGRIKSDGSIQTKIKNLEIERLCKLYAIEDISKQEKTELYQAILEQVNSKYSKLVQNIVSEPITNLESIDIIVKDENIPEKIKTALLRITNTRLLKENIRK